MTRETGYAARQRLLSDSLPVRADFPGWPAGPSISNLPIRRMRRRSKINSDGCQLSRKHPLDHLCMIDADSDAELDFLMFAEVDPTVTFIAAQPTKIAFVHDGGIATHVPDYAVIRAGRAELHEVKGERAASDPAIIDRLASAARHVANWPEWTYRATSTTMLVTDPCRRVVMGLWRHLRGDWDDLQLRAVRDLLRKAPLALADVASSLAGSASAPTRGQILSMAARGAVWIDMDSPIGSGSLLRHPDPQSPPSSILPTLEPGDPAWR